MKRLIVAIVMITAAALYGCSSNAKTDTDMAKSGSIEYRTLELETIDGDTTTLADFEGKVVLIVNTASKCGFTPQYEGLQELYETYGDDGLVVIGFPANNFMGQEPGTNEEIQQFCKTEYSVTFPMMAKISVKGDDQHPLYTYLTEQSPHPGEISWNFNKFLLDREGNVIARFGTRTKPTADEVVGKIEAALKG
ncbi:redoxin domain-containing protein [bacterium]|nr:redoxin domain-containing protein [bacterium]